MYPNPGQTGGWNPNQPGPSPQPSSSAQPQHNNGQWAQPPQGQQQPAQGQQQQQPQQHVQQQQQQQQQQPQQGAHHAQQRLGSLQNQMPPIAQGGQPQGPPMTTLQPQHPDPYRSLPPPQMYGAHPYGQQPPMAYPTQPAPRQRTAIACRYCRRRKIRCSGFDQSEDGRCTNCARFSQECVFTPVSAQTQAFVPAHTVWRNQGAAPQQLYGAFGQPLPQGQIIREYAPPQQPYNPQNGQYQQQPQYGPPGQQQQPQQGQPSPGQQQAQAAGQTRNNDEAHTPSLPPPNPAGNAQLPQQQGQPQRSASGEQQYVYPDPTGLQQTGPSTFGQGQQPRSPQPGYAYDQQLKRESSPAPQTNAAGPGTYPAPTSDTNLRPPPPGQDGRSSPANGTPRQSVRINELVGPSGGQQGEQQAQAN